MNKDFKNLKKYFNENGLRFNLNEERIWNYIEEVFGRKRAEKLSNIFDDQYYNLNDEKVDVKYKFCNNFAKEALPVTPALIDQSQALDKLSCLSSDL